MLKIMWSQIGIWRYEKRGKALSSSQGQGGQLASRQRVAKSYKKNSKK